jgi:hypothetical protein
MIGPQNLIVSRMVDNVHRAMTGVCARKRDVAGRMPILSGDVETEKIGCHQVSNGPDDLVSIHHTQGSTGHEIVLNVH